MATVSRQRLEIGGVRDRPRCQGGSGNVHPSADGTDPAARRCTGRRGAGRRCPGRGDPGSRRSRSRPATPAAPPPPPPPPVVRNPAQVAARESQLRDLRLDLRTEASRASSALSVADPAESHRLIEPMVERVVQQAGLAVTRDERMRLVDEMVHDVTGFGPLEPYSRPDDHRDHGQRAGPRLDRASRQDRASRTAFLNDEHVLRVIERIVAPLGRRIDESSPRVDARLPDGSRVNAIIEPLSLIGPVITVRKFSPDARTRSTIWSGSGPPRPRCSTSCTRAWRHGSTCSSPAERGRARPRP